MNLISYGFGYTFSHAVNFTGCVKNANIVRIGKGFYAILEVTDPCPNLFDSAVGEIEVANINETSAAPCDTVSVKPYFDNSCLKLMNW